MLFHLKYIILNKVIINNRALFDANKINHYEGLMYSLTKTKIKKFLIVLLTLVLTLSLAFVTACNGTDDDSDGDNDNTNTSTEETITDYQVVKNGDFEFSTTETTKYPYSSSISWTRSTDSDKNTATSSTASSGIIDTKDDVWAKLKDNEKPSENPGTPFSKGLITSSDYDYEDEDKRENVQADGTKILMINNKSSVEGLGSAQKFKSSSTISVPVDSYAIVSLWVRTDNIVLKSGEKGGAYILLTDKVSSYSYKNIEVRDINTNGKWEKIEFVIKGSTFNSASFNLTVGLGRGNGTFKADYVEGFAFFDNVQAKVYTASEFKAMNRTDSFTNVDRNTPNYNTYVAPTANSTLSYAYSYEYVKDADVINLTPVANYDFGYNTANVIPSYNYNLATGNEINKATASAVTNQTIKDAIVDIGDAGLSNGAELIYFDFKNASTGYFTTDKIDIPSEGRHYITFYAKTNVNNDKIKMAKVSIVNTTVGEETTTLTALSSFTTTSIEDSAYGKWVKYSILVNNPTDTQTDYKIKFVFGDDESTLIGDVYKLQKGYAIFAGLNVETISEENYELIATGTTVAKSTVYGKYSNYSKDEGASESKDTYSISPDQYGKFEIESKPTSYIPNYVVKGSREGTYIGIVNSKYNDNYSFLTESEKASFASLKDDGNEHAQLVLFKNNTVGTSQLLSPRKTVTANGISKISVKLKVLGDAIAHVRLVDGNPNSDGSYKTLELDAGDWKKSLLSKADKNTLMPDDKWSEICFYVAAGNEAISYRVEITLENPGTLFVKSISDDLSAIESIDALNKEIEVLSKDFEEINLPLSEALTHTRAPATVLSTDEDGNDVTSTRTFEPTEIYTSNNVYTFANFTTIFADTEIDEREEDDTTVEDTTDDDTYQVTTDIGLQISSLILALALIAVLIVVVVKNVRKKTTKRKAKVAEYYSRDTRDVAMEKIAKKKANIDVSSDGAEEEYNYEEAEAINEEEALIEEATEAVIDVEELTEEADVETNEETVEATEATEASDAETAEEEKKED